MKQTREEVAYEYIKNEGPCFLSFSSKDDEITVLLNDGDLFMLSNNRLLDNPFITLKEVMEEAKDIILQMFTAHMDTDFNNEKLYKFEDLLRKYLKESNLEKSEIRDLKIKFLDIKENLLNE